MSMPSSRFRRDGAGHLAPHAPRPADDPADVLKEPSHAPDWALDRDDPARDYADRYVRATGRYGAKTACVRAMPSVNAPAGRTVEMKDAPGEGCPASSAVRDRFVVSVTEDRLHLDGKGEPLKKWPDGSDPEGPSTAPPREDDASTGDGTVKAVLRDAKLTPIRAQWYGRGSYLVVTVAGWHEPVARGAAPEALKALAQKVCAASGGMPVGVFAGFDRTTILRFGCPAVARWDAL